MFYKHRIDCMVGTQKLVRCVALITWFGSGFALFSRMLQILLVSLTHITSKRCLRD